MHHFEYGISILICFTFPFFYGLIHRKLLAKYKLKIINPTVLLAAVPFIGFDLFAIWRGYWQFNSKYITGIKVFNLPVEEILFFILIPQSCLLIWAGMKRYELFSQVKTDIIRHFNKK